MAEDTARQILSLLLTEKGIPVPEGSGESELLQLYLDMNPVPTAAEHALAAIFDAAGNSKATNSPAE